MASRTVDQIIEAVRVRVPQVSVWQLQVHHSADDDGVWFFELNDVQVQIESSSGDFPFLLETSTSDRRQIIDSFELIVSEIVEQLRRTDS